MLARLLIVLAFPLLILLAAPALLAQQRQPTQRVVVEQFQGLGPLIVRPGAVRALEGHPGLEVVPVKALGGEGRVSGGTPQSYAEAARRLGLAAFVSGTVEQVGPSRFMARLVVRGANGQVLGEFSYQSQWVAGVRNEVRKRFFEDVRPLLEGERGTQGQATEPTPAPEHIVLEEEPEPAPEPPPVPSADRPTPGADPQREPRPEDEAVRPRDSVRDARPDERRSRWYSALELEIAGGAAFRDYRYKRESLGPLREYHLLRAPSGAAALTWFPAAPFTRGWGAHVGLTGSFDQMYPINSVVSGQKLSTEARAYSGGVLARIPGSVLELRPSITYGQYAFDVEREYVPDANYQYVRPGFALRLGLFRWRWSWQVGGGFRWLMSTGELEEAPWFPGAVGLGGDAEVETAVRIVPSLELGARARYRVHRFALNPRVGGSYANGVAEIALDSSSDVSLFARWLVGRRR